MGACSDFSFTGDLHLLDRLHAVQEAAYDPDNACFEGTRSKFLGSILTLLRDKSNLNSVWVYGVAGTGKSAISNSVASILDCEKLLGGCFFFKHDIPDLRSPLKVLPTLSRSLAQAYTPYQSHVLSVLGEDADIAGKRLKSQLAALFPKSLPVEPPKQPFIFVVDGLDECGVAEDRTKIVACLLEMTQNIPWLKVFMTSRPTYEIQQAFRESDDDESSQPQLVDSLDLNAADDVEADIYKYNETWIKRVPKLRKKWRQPELLRNLTERACGLFIWSSTVRKYVSDALDCNIALEEILDQTSASAEGPFAALDELYRFVLEQVQGDKLVIKIALGVLACTAKHQPLIPTGLYDLIPAGATNSGLTQIALDSIIERLRSVLYIDEDAGGLVRVCHPSFLDFLISKERADRFWINPSELNAEIFRRCMCLMDDGLRFNICKLESASVPNSEIPNLQQKKEDNIPASLQYSCLYWLEHLLDARDVYDIHEDSAQSLVSGFLCDVKVLFWLELLSLLSKVKAGINILNRCIKAYPVSPVFCTLQLTPLNPLRK